MLRQKHQKGIPQLCHNNPIVEPWALHLEVYLRYLILTVYQAYRTTILVFIWALRVHGLYLGSSDPFSTPKAKKGGHGEAGEKGGARNDCRVTLA